MCTHGAHPSRLQPGLRSKPPPLTMHVSWAKASECARVPHLQGPLASASVPCQNRCYCMQLKAEELKSVRAQPSSSTQQELESLKVRFDNLSIQHERLAAAHGDLVTSRSRSYPSEFPRTNVRTLATQTCDIGGPRHIVSPTSSIFSGELLHIPQAPEAKVALHAASADCGSTDANEPEASVSPPRRNMGATATTAAVPEHTHTSPPISFGRARSKRHTPKVPIMDSLALETMPSHDNDISVSTAAEQQGHVPVLGAVGSTLHDIADLPLLALGSATGAAERSLPGPTLSATPDNFGLGPPGDMGRFMSSVDTDRLLSSGSSAAASPPLHELPPKQTLDLSLKRMDASVATPPLFGAGAYKTGGTYKTPAALSVFSSTVQATFAKRSKHA
jgi:hypothetical protein